MAETLQGFNRLNSFPHRMLCSQEDPWEEGLNHRVVLTHIRCKQFGTQSPESLCKKGTTTNLVFFIEIPKESQARIAVVVSTMRSQEL